MRGVWGFVVFLNFYLKQRIAYSKIREFPYVESSLRLEESAFGIGASYYFES